MSLNDARQLGRGSVRELSELGRRRHDEANDLAAQFVERRQRGKGLDAVDIQDGFTHRTADDDELLVRLGEFDGNLWRRHRILRGSDHGRPLQHGADGNDVSAFKSNFARRFFETFTEAPACFICMRSFCIWATVRPEYWATTATLVVLKTPLSCSTASFFAAR